MPYRKSQLIKIVFGLLFVSLAALAILVRTPDTVRARSSPRPSPNREGQAKPQFRSLQWRTLDDLPFPMAQYNSVFWDPRDTDSLRRKILDGDLVRKKQVLEIGTGTGLIAICCLNAGAEKVVATDVNPLAIANSKHNAERFEVLNRLDARLVPLDRPTAFSVIGPDEKFDLIISNPPWENGRPKTIDEYALYDPNFRLLHSLLKEAHRHLKPGGRIWLAYGCVEAIQVVLDTAPRLGWQVKILDERHLSDLPPVFLPGMLLEVSRVEGRGSRVRNTDILLALDPRL